MTSRDHILNQVRENKPTGEAALPDVSRSDLPTEDLVHEFTRVIESSGAKVVSVDGASHSAIDKEIFQFSDYERVVAHGVVVDGAEAVDEIASEAEFDDVDLFVCRGVLAVAENGAIWITDAECGRRAALFLSEHVAIVLSRSSIVPTLHEAYAQIDVDRQGFGIFVAGPSKTADIEQSLVIGAHGPRSLLVILTD